MKQLLGAHTSIQGGVIEALKLAEKLKFNAIQIFTKNNNRWLAKDLTLHECDAFLKYRENSGVEFIAAHSSYLINLCASNEEILNKSVDALEDEINRCTLLNIPHLNFHPGAHGGKGIDEGIRIISEKINVILDRTKYSNVTAMLEITAGQGTSIGHKFEQIAGIIDLIEDKNRATVCIDTAHLFAAGYDFRTPETFSETFKYFDETIGLNYLKMIHMNDSKKALGSRVDRHDHIGKGMIGLSGFELIMNDKRLENIPKILETPKGKEQLEDLENIAVLESLIK